MNTIGICGKGFIGNALYQSFKNHYNVESYDIIKENSTSESLEELAEKTNVIFLSLPTPINQFLGPDLSIIESSLEKLNAVKPLYVVIRSSVAPGSTQRFADTYKNIKFVFNPEFLREKSAVEDFKKQTKVILGGKMEDTKYIKSIYQKVFPKIDYFETSFTTAEMAKFTINCFLATKVSYFNEIYQICEKLGVDYNEVKNLTLTDERIGDSHVNVPGHDLNFGFGGTCLPRNINILIRKAEQLGIDPKTMQGVWDKNSEVRGSALIDDLPEFFKSK